MKYPAPLIERIVLFLLNAFVLLVIVFFGLSMLVIIIGSIAAQAWALAIIMAITLGAFVCSYWLNN